jgi:hypothetical protein
VDLIIYVLKATVYFHKFQIKFESPNVCKQQQKMFKTRNRIRKECIGKKCLSFSPGQVRPKFFPPLSLIRRLRAADIGPAAARPNSLAVIFLLDGKQLRGEPTVA